MEKRKTSAQWIKFTSYSCCDTCLNTTGVFSDDAVGLGVWGRGRFYNNSLYKPFPAGFTTVEHFIVWYWVNTPKCVQLTAIFILHWSPKCLYGFSFQEHVGALCSHPQNAQESFCSCSVNMAQSLITAVDKAQLLRWVIILLTLR